MKIFNLIEKAFKYVLPSPLTIALLLTIVAFLFALFLTDSSLSIGARSLELVEYWQEGLWNGPLLIFAVQMMLMLVLGHTLALTKPVDKLISYMTRFCISTASAAFWVTLLTIFVSLFNWGLGLVFGAIFARKVGEHASQKGVTMNYPLIGAAGYSGMLVWHGGISGSAPIKVAEEGHIKALLQGVVPVEQLEQLPASISFSETIFGTMNSVSVIAVVLILPFFMFLLGLKNHQTSTLPKKEGVPEPSTEELRGVEKLDHTRFFSLLFGGVMIAYLAYLGWMTFQTKGLAFITPDYINTLLFGLCLVFHQSIRGFLSGIDAAIGGSSAILIQFPLYFGIMGIMANSGLVHVFSDFFVRISSSFTFPIYTFFSAGIVNVFVPSGGGQWGIQGPIILKTAMELGVSLPKAVMAMAYGDQLTNMLQPFWALPLLGITGLSAKSILPYTVMLMMVGLVIAVSVLMIF